jgi:hypothetical protein
MTGIMSELEVDLSGSFVKVFPKTPVTVEAGSLGFGIKLMGCPVSDTAVISFRFKSSKKSIIGRFGRISSFITDMTNYVCVMTSLSSSPSPCSRIVFADLEEQESPNPDYSASSSFQPKTIPTIEIFFRILPGDPFSCSDCRSPKTIQKDLESLLEQADSYGSNILRAIDVWIEDPDPYTCYSKICPEGSLCVDGVCVTPLELLAQQAAGQQLDSPVSLKSASDIDRILNLTPLQVIPGVDQTRGIIVFSKSRAATSSGVNPRVSAAESSTTTISDLPSFWQRFMIPILVVSAFTLIIIGLIAWKAYSRTSHAGTAAGSI